MTIVVTNMAGWKIGSTGKLLIAPGVAIFLDYDYTRAAMYCGYPNLTHSVIVSLSQLVQDIALEPHALGDDRMAEDQLE